MPKHRTTSYVPRPLLSDHGLTFNGQSLPVCEKLWDPDGGLAHASVSRILIGQVSVSQNFRDRDYVLKTLHSDVELF